MAYYIMNGVYFVREVNARVLGGRVQLVGDSG